MITFSKEKPAIYDRCKEHFNVEWDDGVIITYGETVYSKNPLSVFKQAHETMHVVQQQKMGKDTWWEAYFTNPKFRLSQEVEAYKVEVAHINQLIMDRNEKARMIDKCARQLSSSMYGKVCTYKEALTLIK